MGKQVYRLVTLAEQLESVRISALSASVLVGVPDAIAGPLTTEEWR